VGGGRKDPLPIRSTSIAASDLETLRSHKAAMLQMIEQSQSMHDISLHPRTTCGSSVRITANQAQPWNFSRHMGSRIGAMTLGFTISGPIDTQLLRSSLLKLQQRHEPLRTRIDCHNRCDHTTGRAGRYDEISHSSRPSALAVDLEPCCRQTLLGGFHRLFWRPALVTF